jgi:hypothetical protein
VVVYGEVDIEGLDKDAGRAGTEGVTAVIVDGSDDGDEAEGCEPARSHGLGGAITLVSDPSVAVTVSWVSNTGVCGPVLRCGTRACSFTPTFNQSINKPA